MAKLPLAADARDALGTVGAVASQSLLSHLNGFRGVLQSTATAYIDSECGRARRPRHGCWNAGWVVGTDGWS